MLIAQRVSIQFCYVHLQYVLQLAHIWCWQHCVAHFFNTTQKRSVLELCYVTDFPGPRATVKGPGAKNLGSTSGKVVRKTAVQTGRWRFLLASVLLT